MTRAQEILGKRFGRLTVEAIDPSAGHRVICACDCGKSHNAKASHILAGRVLSCGCWRKDRQSVRTLEQLMAMCHVGAPDECWPWKGALGNHGYGRVAFRGTDMTASRAMYLAAHGTIPVGQVICHRCDNPPCVNPAHLFTGTYQDNVADMVKKGRAFWQGGASCK